MPVNAPVAPVAAHNLPQPGGNLAIANIIGAGKISEKTVELTTCAQFGALFGTNMVWFGLTQAQERQYGFDAAADLGGQAFILQFKVSATVPQSGSYPGQRRFTCQHHQMDRLKQNFGATPNACFYFLPDVGRFTELINVGGDILGHSYILDVANLPNPVPATDRASGYHYVYLDTIGSGVTITSTPERVNQLKVPKDLVIAAKNHELAASKELRAIAVELDSSLGRSADMFYKNAALIVLPG